MGRGWFVSVSVSVSIIISIDRYSVFCSCDYSNADECESSIQL